MKKIFRSPHRKLMSILLVFAIILTGRLFILTVVQNDKWQEASNSLSIRGIYTPSPRGEIYDRNGVLLAGNKQIFTVKMSAGNKDNAELNKASKKLISLLEKNNDEYIDNLPIIIEDGEFSYTYQKDVKNGLKENNISSNSTAEEAFYSLASSLGISSKMDRFEIQQEMQSKHNVYPPISVRDMTWNADKEQKEFLKSYGFEEDLSAEDAFVKLKEKFEIDKVLSDKQTRKIMVVRNELKSLGFKKYMPASIAKDVSEKTVLQVEEGSSELSGVEVVSETKRYYPKGNTASHILGYIGKISSSEVEEYEKKGYEASTLVGKEGIEGEFESVLKGQDGTEIIRVNSKGEYEGTINTIDPKKGKDVFLSIDSDLQQKAEDALERNIKSIRYGGSFGSEFGTIGASKVAPKASTGAVVAIDVETGEVLAMASYPDFDPNLFTEGISSEDWASLQSENLRDPVAPAPLYNVATKSAVQPGSTFKPVTAIAALQSGLDPNAHYKDNGAIKMGGRTFACVVWNINKSNHGYINLYRALEVSCNYYFADIATGKDWYTGKSLGFKDPMSIEKIVKYANEFGLGLPTGIEIPETVVPAPTEQNKINGLKNNLTNVLNANAEFYFTKDVYSNSKRLEKDIAEIVSWMDIENLKREDLLEKYMPKVGLKESKYDKFLDTTLYTYFNQAKWSVGDSFNIAIGQGDNAYTPLQMANYIATLGNDGVYNKVNLVKSIEDEGQKTKEKGKKITIDDDKYLDDVITGMKRVATGSGSSISKHYANFPWTVAAKTGTAQRSGYINPKSEVDYIKSHLSSFGNMSWASVEKEMKRLLKEYPETYLSENTAVRRAVINLSKNKVSYADLNRFKGTYDEFAWVTAMAPADDPKIAVCSMIVQGVTASNANAVVREVMGQYLKKIDPNYVDKNEKKNNQDKEKNVILDDMKLGTNFN